MNLDYIAGLFDGEGCVRIHKKKTDKYTVYAPIVEINLTNEEAIDYLMSVIGGKKYTKHWKNNKNYKTVYRWVLAPKQKVKKFLESIEKRTIIKKREIRETLKYFEGKDSEEVYLEVRRLKRNGY